MERHRHLVLSSALTLLLLSVSASAAAPWSPDCAECAATFTIEGQPMHIEKRSNRGPIVVFESGLGADSSAWRTVAGPISGFAQVVRYDRAGLGMSKPFIKPGRPITASGVAEALHQLLARADLHPPFILVGHSLGGLYMQMFARVHPDEVAGMVLLDSSSTEAPAALKTRAKLVPGSVDFLEEAGVAESNREVRAAGPFPAIPLTIIAATDHGPYFGKWEPTLMRLQQQLATLSPRGMLVVASGSGHDVATDRPALVVAAVRTIADAASSQR
jgi:pimeloyl-ACP methyl ester carboxylesterase